MSLDDLMKLMEEEHFFKATYVSNYPLLGIHMLRYRG